MNTMLLSILSDILNVIGGIFSLIPKLIYWLISCCLSIIDLFQVAFRKLAGLDPIIFANETTVYQGDPVYKLITDALFTGKYPAINTIFWSLIILAVFMLVATTVIAMLKLEYNPDKEKGNSKSGVIKSFFKAIISFAVVPIVCLFGFFISNALVAVIDSATATPVSTTTEIATRYNKWSAEDDSSGALSGGETLNQREDSYMAFNVFGLHIPTTSEPFSGTIFRACAYGSNRIRNNTGYFELLKSENCLGFMSEYDTQNEAADIIDTGFAIDARLKTKTTLKTDNKSEFWLDFSLFNIGSWSYKEIESLDKYNANAVWYFYDLWTFNYIIACVAILVIGKLYYQFVTFLMQRMFEIIALFLVSPISVSLMPLDGGESLKSWRKTFVTKFALLVIMVLSLNLVTPLLSICRQIKLFDIELLDCIFTTFFLISALNAVNSLNGMLSGILAGDGKAFEQVGKAGEAFSSSLKGGATAAAGVAGFATKVGTLPLRLGAKGAKAGIDALTDKANPENRYARHSQAEREEIQNQLHFGHEDGSEYSDDEINDQWGGDFTTNGGRDENKVESFLNTDQGKQFVEEHYGGDETQAFASLSGLDGHDVANTDARRQYMEYMHDQELWEKSDEAQRLRDSGASAEEVAAAQNRYHNQTKEDKVDYFVGGNLSARQRDIVDKKQKAYKAANSKGHAAVKWMSNAGKAVGGALATGFSKLTEAGKKYGESLKPMTGIIPGSSDLTGTVGGMLGAFGFGKSDGDKKE